MAYSNKDYQSDLSNPDMLHLKTRKRFQAFYDQCALGLAKHIKYEAERMNWISFRPNSRLIELGCCSGQNVVEWLSRYPTLRYTAVDVSQGFVDETKRRVEEAGFGDRVVYHVGFIEDLPGGNVSGTYTDVVLTETLEHVQNPLPVLKVAWSLVSDGGNLWITVPSRRVGTYSHVRGIAPKELRVLLTKAGIGEVLLLDKVSDRSTGLATRCHVTKTGTALRPSQRVRSSG